VRIWETSFAASVIPALQWRNILFSWQAFWPDPVVACLASGPHRMTGGAAPGPPAFFAFRQQHDGQACRGASPALPLPMLLAQCVKCRGFGGGAPKRHERSQNPTNLCFGCGRRPLQGSRDPGAAGLGASRGVDSRPPDLVEGRCGGDDDSGVGPGPVVRHDPVIPASSRNPGAVGLGASRGVDSRVRGNDNRRVSSRLRQRTDRDSVGSTEGLGMFESS